MSTEKLSLIMPVYNEEDAIEHVINSWIKKLEELHICYQIHIYNDGSNDNTLQRIEEAKARHNKIFVHDKKNTGHGPTIIQGYRENCTADWIFQVDSDDEMSPAELNTLWQRRSEFDFLIGNRTNRVSSLSRKIISIMSRIIVKLFYGKGVIDVNSPYRLIRTELFRELFFSIPEKTFAPNIIISGYAANRKMKILELPVQHVNRRTGTVSIASFKLLRAAFLSFCQIILFRFSKTNTFNID